MNCEYNIVGNDWEEMLVCASAVTVDEDRIKFYDEDRCLVASMDKKMAYAVYRSERVCVLRNGVLLEKCS